MRYYPTLGSEKCVIRELWETHQKVAENGWALSGSPKVLSDLTLNGTDQWAQRGLEGEFSLNELTIVMEFTPDFDWDADVTKAFWYTTDVPYFGIYKRGSVGSYVLRLYLSGVLIADITSATYSPYWKVGQRNVLVVSGKSGNNNAWLNGGQIITNNALAWSGGYPLQFYVGRGPAGYHFDGIIHEFHIFQEAWDASQEAAWRNRSTFRYQDHCSVWLDMKTKAGTGVSGNEYRTLDRSGKGEDFLVGTGLGASEPDFLNPGYECDGTNNEYLEMPSASGIYNTSEQTIVFGFRPHFKTTEDVLRVFFDSVSPSRYCILKRASGSSYTMGLLLGNVWLTNIAESTYGPHWKSYGDNVLVLSGKSGNNRVWLNGVRILTETTAWTAKDPSTIQLGIAYPKNADRFKGVITHFSTAPILVGDIQVREITNRLLRGVS